MAQDKHYSSNIKEYNSDGSYYYLEIPSITKDTVVTIKDEKGNTVASLKDGILDSSLSLSYGSLKQTFFCYMPVEKTYDITISGAESYNLSYFDQRLENMVSYKKEVKLDGKNVKIQTEKYIERKEDENVK